MFPLGFCFEAFSFEAALKYLNMYES